MKLVKQVFLFLICVSRVIVAEEEAANEDAADAYEDAGGNGYYNEFSVCSDSIVIIDEISLLCDSPGTYYYGSGKYRNSAKCQGGDKARLQIEFYVSAQLEQAAYVSIGVEGYGTVESISLHTNVDACALEGLQAANGYSPCYEGILEVGYYVFKETFYWGGQNDAYEYSFKPKVVVGLRSDPNKNQYDIGGANTEKCAGNTFLKWTTGVGKSASNTLKTFFITFGILVFAIFSILFAVFFIMKSANKPARVKVGINEDLIEKDNESHKIAMIGQNKDVVAY